ncbi:MAG TPA: alpha/beta hydrolase [Gaiellaceae bacterium]|nr:alpha/beta hydrolase [Gaiellaceae bacterium]
MGWATACALTSWRRLGGLARVPALVLNELPFLVGYLLIASALLALTQGDLESTGGPIVGAVLVVELLGLVVIVRRALRADGALHNPTAARRPWRRILLAPLPAFRRDIVRVPNLAYGEGPRRNLDVYHHRDRPAVAPVVLHFHGGGFRSSNKRREARPLIGHLVTQGMVCASANYRLRPHVEYDEQLTDVLAAIEWVRSHAPEYGGDPDQIFLVGSLAGAYMSIGAVNAGTDGIAGIVGRYGYYGDLMPAAATDPGDPRGERPSCQPVERPRIRRANACRLEPPGRVRRASRRPPRLRSLRVDPLECHQRRGRAVHHALERERTVERT